jgi:hypothetical protein
MKKDKIEGRRKNGKKPAVSEKSGRLKKGQRFGTANIGISRAAVDRIIGRVMAGERSIAAIEKEGMHFSRFYSFIARCPESKEAYSRACDARDIPQLEDEAFRRAVTGVDKPVFQKGECVGFIREYSDNLLTLLLRCRRPEVFHKPETNISVNSKAEATVNESQIILSEEQQNKIHDIILQATQSAKEESNVKS